MKACCGNCRFWREVSAEDGVGECWRFPPVPLVFRSREVGEYVLAYPPETDLSDWCGEWQERPAEQSDIPHGQAIDAIKAELLKRKIKSEKIVGRHSRHDDLIGDRECNFHRGYAAAAEDVLEMLNATFGKENA